MALQKKIEIEGRAYINTGNGPLTLGMQTVEFDAYCKITSLTGNKTQANITIECVGEQKKIVQQYTVPLSVAERAPNFIKQAYVYLKTLPEWAGATDC
jgi:hypothetical protein